MENQFSILVKNANLDLEFANFIVQVESLFSQQNNRIKELEDEKTLINSELILIKQRLEALQNCLQPLVNKQVQKIWAKSL